MTAPVEQSTSEDIGYLTHVDPRTLILGDNVRTVADIGQQRPRLVANIAKRGVKQAVIANDTGDGLLLRVGFSRVLAAVLAVDTHPLIPVHVVPADDDDAERLIDQLTENDFREELTAGERAEAIERLTLFGLPAGDIAEQLTTDQTEVHAALALRRSTTATDMATKNPQLSIVHLAAFAEFEDNETATAALLETLSEEPDQFDFEVALQRRLAHEDTARAELTQQLGEAGITVVDSSGLYNSPQRWLTDLCPSDQDRTPFDGDDPEAHAACPGHAAVVVTKNGEPQAQYVCTDWKRHGHALRFSASAPGAAKRGMSAYEKAELRRVKTNNTAWRAAEDVRREFLRTLLRRSSPPKQAQQFIAAELAAGDHWLRRAMERQHSMACTLLDLPEPTLGKRNLLQPRKKATANESIMVALAVILGGYEQATSTDTWRRPDEAMTRYFTTLAQWGYALSPVERLVIDPSADTDRWPHLHQATGGEDSEDGDPSQDGDVSQDGATPGAEPDADPPAHDPEDEEPGHDGGADTDLDEIGAAPPEALDGGGDAADDMADDDADGDGEHVDPTATAAA